MHTTYDAFVQQISFSLHRVRISPMFVPSQASEPSNTLFLICTSLQHLLTFLNVPRMKFLRFPMRTCHFEPRFCRQSCQRWHSTSWTYPATHHSIRCHFYAWSPRARSTGNYSNKCRFVEVLYFSRFTDVWPRWPRRRNGPSLFLQAPFQVQNWNCESVARAWQI